MTLAAESRFQWLNETTITYSENEDWLVKCPNATAAVIAIGKEFGTESIRVKNQSVPIDALANGVLNSLNLPLNNVETVENAAASEYARLFLACRVEDGELLIRVCMYYIPAPDDVVFNRIHRRIELKLEQIRAEGEREVLSRIKKRLGFAATLRKDEKQKSGPRKVAPTGLPTIRRTTDAANPQTAASKQQTGKVQQESQIVDLPLFFFRTKGDRNDIPLFAAATEATVVPLKDALLLKRDEQSPDARQFVVNYVFKLGIIEFSLNAISETRIPLSEFNRVTQQFRLAVDRLSR